LGSKRAIDRKERGPKGNVSARQETRDYSQLVLSATTAHVIDFVRKGAIMKTDSIYKPESRTVVILTALATGLGIAVHKVFFLFAAAIALSVPFGRFIEHMREAEEKSTARHRHA
jgi:hypothetical protein